MTLDVGFGYDVDTIFITQIVPTRIVAIVTGTHGIHVQLLHYLDVFDHALYADEITSIGIEFMAVSALEKDGLTIDEDLRILDFNATEAYTLTYHFECIAFLAFQGKGKGVEIG